MLVYIAILYFIIGKGTDESPDDSDISPESTQSQPTLSNEINSDDSNISRESTQSQRTCSNEISPDDSNKPLENT